MGLKEFDNVRLWIDHKPSSDNIGEIEFIAGHNVFRRLPDIFIDSYASSNEGSNYTSEFYGRYKPFPEFNSSNGYIKIKLEEGDRAPSVSSSGYPITIDTNETTLFEGVLEHGLLYQQGNVSLFFNDTDRNGYTSRGDLLFLNVEGSDFYRITVSMLNDVETITIRP